MFKIPKIDKAYRGLKRYQEIITVIFKHGLGDVLQLSNLTKHVKFHKDVPKTEDENAKKLTRYQKVRVILEKLGPTFIKLGQIMSNRPDLLPADLIKELVLLRDEVEPFDGTQAKKIVEEELGDSVESLFTSFDEKPVNSASIAQVHHAVLKDGTEVAIKVQRPKIRETVKTDIEIMHHLANFIENNVEGADIISPQDILEEFERSIKQELDFTVESSHYEIMRKNLKGDDDAYIPKVYDDLTTEKILTLEFIKGTRLSTLKDNMPPDMDGKKIAQKGGNIILKQIFEHGFFHADPHPGNIFILENEVVCLLDMGIVGTLTGNQRENLGSILIGVTTGDATLVTSALLELAETAPMDNIDKIEKDVTEFVGRYSSVKISTINVAKLLDDLIGIFIAHKLKMPQDLYVLLRVLVTIEGSAKSIDHEFNIIKLAEPIARKLITKKFSPAQVFKDIYDTAYDFRILLKKLPSEMRDILKLVRKGKVNVIFQHKGLEPMLKTHDRMSDRLSFAIVTAALIIGSSLMVVADVPPKWGELPIIGIVGFILAGIIGFWLIISMIRSGKM